MPENQTENIQNMNYLRIALTGIILCFTFGCKPEYYVFGVENFRGDTVKVEYVYNRCLLPPDSSISYVHKNLPAQLRLIQNPEADTISYFDEAAICLEHWMYRELEYEIKFKGSTMTFIIPPPLYSNVRTGVVEINYDNRDLIYGLIDRITVTAGKDTAVYSTPETVKSILKKSKYYNGFHLRVDSAMFAGKPKP